MYTHKYICSYLHVSITNLQYLIDISLAAIISMYSSKVHFTIHDRVSVPYYYTIYIEMIVVKDISIRYLNLSLIHV